MLCVPADPAEGVYVTEQVPEPFRVQAPEVPKVPVPEEVKLTVPPGVEAPPPDWVSVTDAVQVVVWPVPTGEGEQATEVEVVRLATA